MKTKKKQRWKLTEDGKKLSPRRANKVWEVQFHPLDVLGCRARVVGRQRWEYFARAFFVKV